MNATVRLDELLDYSDHERAKWKAWVAADPARMQLPFQPGGRFPTVGSLLDHLFLVERRHLARLEGATPPEMTGIAAGDWNGLFDYASLVRADLRRYVADLDDELGTGTLTINVQAGTFMLTRRKLAVHILLHEVRHLAQLAYAVRAAGLEPPGAHDLFYCPEVA
ncbi:MAG TPA: DinB family protein [Vicinamibacterales bacterium]